MTKEAELPQSGQGQVGSPPTDAPALELFDLLGRRWAMRVLWELRSDGLTYRDLAARIPDLSTSVLTHRLRDLRQAQLVEHQRGAGYHLTAQGQDLVAHLERLRQWALDSRFAFSSSGP
jgi:DNA-binding HxlR family transcriptional regulator